MTQTAPRIVLQNVSVNIPLLSARHLTLTNAALRFGTGGKLAMSSANDHGPQSGNASWTHRSQRRRQDDAVARHGGILPPTKGTSKVSGRVALIINPAMGLNPELTGREAIRS